MEIYFPDNSMINPQLQAIFERVRQSADFMPTWQMEVKYDLCSDYFVPKTHSSTVGQKFMKLSENYIFFS